MFTGIIQSVSSIQDISLHGGILSVSISMPPLWKEVSLGESIAINGVCSTVVAFDTVSFTVQYMSETLRKTTITNWTQGNIINLEKSLRVGDSLDGHFVMGHVDGVGQIMGIVQEGESQVFEVVFSADFIRYIANKWSVTLDGISLTVSSIAGNIFTVSLIPYTLNHTNFYLRKVGDSINIELDILAKYILKS